MPSITNDSELRLAIEGLSFEQQRALGVRFAESVIGFTDDARLKKALQAAIDPSITEEELVEAYKTAKAISTATYTACGRDTDWMAQAEHFVAATLQAALAPPEQHPGKSTPAWKAAMQARMARNCAMIESGEGGVDNEAQRQYRIAEGVLG
jgi:aromatic ring hydroxylase